MKKITLGLVLLLSSVNVFALKSASEARRQSTEFLLKIISGQIDYAVEHGEYGVYVTIEAISQDVQDSISQKLKDKGYSYEWVWDKETPDTIRLTIFWDSKKPAEKKITFITR